MTKTAHTSAPWHVGMRPGPYVYGPRGEEIARCNSVTLDDRENRANARLVAAAPALLDALVSLVEYVAEIATEDGWADCLDDVPGFVSARAAIDAATGTTP